MDMDTLKTVPADLSKLSYVRDNNIFKKLSMRNWS